MSKVLIDYTLLLASAPIIENGVEGVRENIYKLPDIRENIQNLGKEHDNCFSKMSDDIEYDLTKNLEKLLQLSDDMITTVNLFSQAELASVKTLSITSKGLEDALKYQYANTFNEKLTGYDYDYYQSLFNKTMSLATDNRTRTTMAALFLATSFPHMNYFWGGGHESICEGLDPTWGDPRLVTAEGSETTGTKQPNSLDCSGYVSWVLKNGGYNIEKPMTTWELENIGEKTPLINSNEKDIKVGDLAYMDGHIGVIVRIDNKDITISHCSGTGGMNITKMDTTTGLVTEDWNKEANRVGQPYFTDIIKVNYND
ncbi:MAG: NlpC/P60 family protein [bacterium]|nr:NlpC/P60 family protein [bacterium]